MELYILPDTKEVNRDNKLLSDKYTKQSLEHKNSTTFYFDQRWQNSKLFVRKVQLS